MNKALVIAVAIMTILAAAGCKNRAPVAETEAPVPKADEPSSEVESREAQVAAEAAGSGVAATKTAVAAGEAEKRISTDFRDLSEGSRGQLEALLRTDDLTSLTGTSLEVLWEYFESKVFRGLNPISRGVTSNYFWFVYNALPEFVHSKERHHGYYQGENEQPQTERLLAYAIHRLDRSPSNLSRLFEMFGPRLKDMVPASVYDELGLRQTVDQLIGTHEEISGVERHREMLSQFYNAFYTPTRAMKVDDNEIVGSLYNSSYGFSSQELSMLLSQRLGFDRFSPHYNSPHLSFWMRRNAEGNMDEVLRILKEIQSIY